MEDSAKLRLQWHDHGNELSRLSREIFGNDDLTDVTLTCRGGTPFHAHKIILAAASTYFKSFFREVQGKINQHPVIFMKDVEPSEMKYLLQFIYRGEVDIPSEELERLIEIAKDLGIVGLDAVNTDNGEQKSERRTLKGTKRKSTASPVASTSKQPKVKNEHDDPLGDEDFGDFIDDDGADDDDDDDGDDGQKENRMPNIPERDSNPMKERRAHKMSLENAERQKKVEGSRILTAIMEKYTEIQCDNSTDPSTKAKMLNEYISGTLESLQQSDDPCMPTKEDMLKCIQRWRQKEREDRRRNHSMVP